MMLRPMAQGFLQDVVDGLRRTPKRVPSKYFYDRRGSELFERICELDECFERSVAASGRALALAATRPIRSAATL